MAKNFLFLLSDEQTRGALGCYGHPMIKTPNLDGLASRGTLFENAYCNSPICVPSRASLATGRYVHDIRYWDNATPYDGREMSWGHFVRRSGVEAVSIGKLHYRSTEDDNGFSEEIDPLHCLNGTGDLLGLIRKDMVPRVPAKNLANKLGPGSSTYTEYDLRITSLACEWLRSRGLASDPSPFVLFVSLVSPHFPLVAPQDFFDLYPLDSVPMPKLSNPEDWPRHPVIDEYRRVWNYGDFFNDETTRLAIANYFGLCSFLDNQIGQVLAALEDSGMADETVVLYASDHGESLGNRGLWGKSTMFEDSVGVPMIIAGQGLPSDQVCKTPVSLVDVFPTILDVTESECDDGLDRPGQSLIGIAQSPHDLDRSIFSEYHAAGSLTGHFMLRKGSLKLVLYPGYDSQLFDLSIDPEETSNLANDPNYCGAFERLEAELRELVNVEDVNKAAFSDQKAKLELHGGMEAIRMRGEYGYTPAPGQRVEYEKAISTNDE